MSELILTRDAGAIRYLTMNRPEKLNAMNDALVGQLAAALRTAEADRDVAVIVLAGAGRAFCAGADLGGGNPGGGKADKGKTGGEESAKTAPTGHQIAARLEDIIRFYGTIQRMDTPVIAAVQGYAMGGGCNLAVSCDLVVAADNAMFGYPEVKLGMAAAGVAPTLVHQIGRKAAFELLTLCNNIDARQALAFGMINRIVPADELLATASAMAEQLAGFNHDALRLTKQLIRRAADLPFAQALEAGRDTGLAMHLFT
ncbi:MAG: enoyl-CoA hydratase/isomerase family protein [Porticoccaceae bacterium]|nr:MAG: enoyl-CoA hydratase/isomerase family protein [Porticoccaceae bacterium]